MSKSARWSALAARKGILNMSKKINYLLGLALVVGLLQWGIPNLVEALSDEEATVEKEQVCPASECPAAAEKAT